ncbi:MAG: site-specific DNA-methyltransferase [Bacteroidota bacterium]
MENINDLMPFSHDWNKERLTQLKNLFPDLFTNEGKLNIEELKKVVDPASVSETERYEFRWFGKSEAKRNAYTPSNATLIFDEQRSMNQNESENIIIEGENLEVLKLLSDNYREQVKCIYIDPPYNTGKDFIYTDNYTEEKKPYWEQTGVTENGLKIDTNAETDGRFHSNWLNMMYSRLLIARAMLKPEGVIFISIDDNEVHHLRKLCDEVFGEENLVGVFAWKNKYGAGAKTRGFIEVHEYIYCYSKNPLKDIEAELTTEQINEYKKKDEKFPIRGGYVTQPLMTKSLDDRENLQYSIVYDGKTIKPRKQWVWEETRLLEAIKNKEIVIKEKKNGTYSVRAKVYLKDEHGIMRKGKPITILNGPFNQEGTQEVEDLLGEDIFSFPKPKKLLTYLYSFIINNKDDKNGIYLDFFAGSGTSGHAIHELNMLDGGKRKYILVQMPEAIDEKSDAAKSGYKKISDITIARNKRVIEKILEEKKKKKPDLFTDGHKEDATEGLGFKVFKLVKSNFPRVEWAPDIDKTDEENIALLKKYISDKEAQLVTAFNRDELLTEILLKNGFQLNYKTSKQEQFKKNEILLATDGIKETLICLDVAIDSETIEHFKKNTDKKFICLERALDTTNKYNLKHYLGDLFKAF